jgi:hypothetical protein
LLKLLNIEEVNIIEGRKWKEIANKLYNIEAKEEIV